MREKKNWSIYISNFRESFGEDPSFHSIFAFLLLLRFDTERNIVEAKIRGQEMRAVYFSNYLRIVLNLIRRKTMDLMEKSVYIFP